MTDGFRRDMELSGKDNIYSILMTICLDGESRTMNNIENLKKILLNDGVRHFQCNIRKSDDTENSIFAIIGYKD